MIDEPKRTNRLVNEKSPYLLQHAHNPVDWYPWGEEAFQCAKDRDQPIFLSIGYATCHWCHVMERESFEKVEIADHLNETFVNIKVDREELPEVDRIYMEFAQSMMKGAAGWPLNVILTPDLKPFFAFTYLPARSREGLMGLIDLVDRIGEVWRSEERERIVEQADKIVELFSKNIHTKGDQLPSELTLDAAMELLYKMADPVYGGLRGAPKFPIGYQICLFIRYSFLKNDSRAFFIADKTLDMMQRGGIYDHLGGGFSRYSVDEKWLVPHFEKMLYDNALLCQAYLEGWKICKRELFGKICQELIQYVIRDLTCPQGAFQSAQDSDSDGKEGYFYTWTVDEIDDILGNEDAALFCDYFNVTRSGNFESRNILHLTDRLEEYVEKHQPPRENIKTRLELMQKKMFHSRKKRPSPSKDDKILSPWNGLMIYSIVEAGAAFNNQAYIDQGVRAAEFLKTHLWKDGKLLRRWREGEAKHTASLDDYAFVIRGALSLFETGCGTKWLEWAIEMADILAFEFKSEGGGFYQTNGADENLVIRNCQYADGAEPSGNGVHCENLLRLHQITADPVYLEGASDILKAVKPYLDTYAPGYGFHMMNLLRFYDKKTPTLVIALNDQREHYEEIHQSLFKKFIPNKAVIWRDKHDKDLFELIPFVREQQPVNGKTTAFICQERRCEKTLVDRRQILEGIDRLSGN